MPKPPPRADRPHPVTHGAQREASRIATLDPAAPIDDLTPLRASVDDAVVVGLGESVHGTAEETRLEHRTPPRDWLHRPATTRGLPDAGPDGRMTGGSLARWFDVVVDRQTVTRAKEIA
jgi:hypothetical protein